MGRGRRPVVILTANVKKKKNLYIYVRELRPVNNIPRESAPCDTADGKNDIRGTFSLKTARRRPLNETRLYFTRYDVCSGNERRTDGGGVSKTRRRDVYTNWRCR